jgi:hypothetical protein
MSKEDRWKVKLLRAQLDRAIHCVSLLEIKGCPFDWWTTCPELDRGLAQDCRRCWNNYIMEGEG